MAYIEVDIRLDTTLLDRIYRTLPLKTAAATLDAAKAVVEDIKKTLDVPYPPASKPGEPPHKRSGALRDSYVALPMQSFSGGKSSVSIISGNPTASFLEFGTAKMAARPHVRPAMLRAAKTFKDRYAVVVKP